MLSRDFLSFARKAIGGLDGTTIGDDPYLHYLARKLSQFAEEETRRLIINLPPGHLKTMLGSVCMTAWLLAHQPRLKIIIITHAETLSKTIARNIRTVIQSGWFKEVFATRIKRGHAEVTVWHYRRRRCLRDVIQRPLHGPSRRRDRGRRPARYWRWYRRN